MNLPYHSNYAYIQFYHQQQTIAPSSSSSSSPLFNLPPARRVGIKILTTTIELLGNQ